LRKISFVGLLFLFVFSNHILCQGNYYFKVHFLYGSKPKKEFQKSEPRWFGGIWGGHVGIEVDSNTVLDFVPEGKFHWIAKNKNPHCKFAVHAIKDFYEIFGGTSKAVKKATVVIPITKQQKQKLDSITLAYTAKPPYDYAFIGMRCGSAAYNILAQLGILKQYSYGKTYRRIFYPRRLRKRLLKKAKENNWAITKQNGTERREWEED